MTSFDFLVLFFPRDKVKVKYKKFISRPLVLYGYMSVFRFSSSNVSLFSLHLWCICSTTCMLCISSLLVYVD